MAKKKSKHYVNNKDFQAEMIKSKVLGELTPGAIDSMIRIANRLASTQFYYTIEDDRETCKSQGIEDCLRYWKNYDPDVYDNPFAYFTRAILNGMMRQFNELYKIPASRRISISNISNLYNI